MFRGLLGPRVPIPWAEGVGNGVPRHRRGGTRRRDGAPAPGGGGGGGGGGGEGGKPEAAGLRLNRTKVPKSQQLQEYF